MAKNRNFGQILSFWGLLYRPLLPMRVKFGVLQQARSARLRAKFRLDQFILSSSGGENPQFLPFFGLRHLVVSPVGNSLRKLNTVHNYKLSPSVEEGTFDPLLHAKFHPHRCNVSPLLGEKLKIGL